MVVVHVSMSMVVLDYLLLADLFLAYGSFCRDSINSYRQIGFYALEDQPFLSGGG